ncbi:nucleolar protein 4-like [Tachypleus tridentatus]|uniref:nucleolar protein 4-like n=1 Tax=Tachypleus tridentatus TaxID=6853 RepID=UPI003FD0AA88
MERRHNTRYAAALAAVAAAPPKQSDNEKGIRLEKEREDREPRDITDSPSVTSKQKMYECFQSWALKTYGDSAKTKTVTRRKYNRILKILKGDENDNAENSKFRFWVKAKAFRIGPPPDQQTDGKRSDKLLYVPCSRLTPSGGREEIVYKKVAVVENFFDIIFGVHVEMDGRGGKHAGQKRTYKAIAKTYAFLPREAVTHFLMSCADCQKRMHLAAEGATNNNGRKGGYQGNGERSDSSGSSSPESRSPTHGNCSATAEAAAFIDYSLPITTTYLKRMRSLGFSDEDALNPDRKVGANIKSEEEDETRAPSSATVETQIANGGASDAGNQNETQRVLSEPSVGESDHAVHESNSGMNCEKKKNENSIWPGAEPINMARGSSSVTYVASGYAADHSYDRILSTRNSSIPQETTPDDTSLITKDDEDEDDDDESDKIDINKYDPDRLKAFNMFVRLFVDENLDRMVPISRQPKEKIQAIIESCMRQFPELSDRARKRIRTYLKSCRRAKRTRDHNGLELGRSAPHLSSPMAEQILSTACENESQNAKRMRLGLKPIPVEIERSRTTSQSACTPVSNPQNDSEILQSSTVMNKSHQALHQESQFHAQLTQSAHHSLLGPGRNMAHPGTSTSTRAFIINGEALTSQPSNNSLFSNTTYRGASQSSFHGTTTFPQHSSINHQSSSSSTTINGPTDLSMKKNPSSKYSLNPSEVAAVKQLVAGYRESAVFLLRSADELEQLLVHRN